MRITNKNKLKKIGAIIWSTKPINYVTVNFLEDTIMKAPIWFKKFEKKNDARWAKNDTRWEEQMKFNKMIFEKLENIIIKNKLKT